MACGACLQIDWNAGGGAGSGCALLSGCTMVGPDFKRPQLPSWLAGWTGGSLESLDAATRGLRSGLVQEWWRSFNDPVLDHLVAEAQRVNPNVRTAGLHHGSARPTRDCPQHALPAGPAGHWRCALGGRGKVERKGHQRAVFPRRAGHRLGNRFWGKFRRSIEAADAGYLPASPSTMTCKC